MAKRFKSEMSDSQYASLPIVGAPPKNENEEKYLREIKEFEFSNLEEPRMMHKFSYGDTRKMVNFMFMPGGKYRVPRHVARHVETRRTPEYKFAPDGTGSMNKRFAGYKQRFQMREVF